MNAQLCPFCGSSIAAAARFCPVCGSAQQPTATGSTNSSVLAPGTAIGSGKYIVDQVLGRGGFGITYLGTDQQLKRRVAIKEFFPAGSVRRATTVVPPDTLAVQDHAAATERFLQESQMLCRFTHPSIVTVHEVFRDNATAYMVMEYLQGETMTQRLERAGGRPLAEADLLRLTEPLTRALEQIHAASVIHRDIKPDNIMIVQRDGIECPVLIDFGAARAYTANKTARQSVTLTEGYAPLEQYGDRARFGPYTDLYALGATLYHLATAMMPPQATDRAVGIELKQPRTLNPLLSVAFDRAIMHALEMKVAQRPQSARSFWDELSGTPVIVPPPISSTPHLDRIREIAPLVRGGSSRDETKTVCPVCQATTLIEPRKGKGRVRCAVCRNAGLEERIPAEERDRCPNCRSGELVSLTDTILLRCPACHVGRILTAHRRRWLIFVDRTAHCDTCAAAFKYDKATDSLTLSALPSAGYLTDVAVNQTKTRTEWSELAGHPFAYAKLCSACQAEFDVGADELISWVAVDRKLDGVPNDYRNRKLSVHAWDNIAHGLPPATPSHHCPGCQAVFDQQQPGRLTLIEAQIDPWGMVQQYRGQQLSEATWRALAAGMRSPGVDGLICPRCTAELTRTEQDSYRLIAYNPADDPRRVGITYSGQSFGLADWQRIAAGKLPASQEQALLSEAQRELWLALIAGEGTNTPLVAEYTGLSASERVVLSIPASQYRTTKKGRYRYDSGTLWVTTKRLAYHGDRGNVMIPLDKIQGIQAMSVSGDTALLEVVRSDRVKPIFLRTTETMMYTVDGLQLKLVWNAAHVADVVNAVRRIT